MWLYCFGLVLTIHCPGVVIFFMFWYLPYTVHVWLYYLCTGNGHTLSRYGYVFYVPLLTILCPGVVIFFMFQYLPDAVFCKLSLPQVKFLDCAI